MNGPAPRAVVDRAAFDREWHSTAPLSCAEGELDVVLIVLAARGITTTQ